MFTLARWRNLAPLALVLLSAVIAVGAYLQVLDAPFVSDDELYITTNTKLAGLHLTELWRLFTEPYNNFSEFLPLRDLSYWFDITLFGLTPAAFRLHNIVLYLLCLPLVYWVTLGIWKYFRPADATSAPWAAAAVTALFALHPSHVEAVVWISGRKDVLAAMFSLLALWFAVNAKREQGLSAPYAAAALAAFVAAMLSKVLFAALAPVIALLWVMFWRDSMAGIPAVAQPRKAKARKVKTQETPSRHYSMLLWPLGILFLAGFLAWLFMASSAQQTYVYFGVEALVRTLAVLGWLARLAVSPESRHFLYPVFEDPYLPAMAALGVAVLTAAIAGAVMLLRKRSLEGFALLAFVLLCVPYIHLIPYGPPSLVSDRWLALAVWPAVLLLVALAWRLKPMPRTVLLSVIALAWCWPTIERPRDWRSTEAMIDADMRAFPGHYMPAMYKALNQLPQGLYREANDAANSITAPEFRDVLIGMIKADQAVHVDAVATGKPEAAMARIGESWLDHPQPPVQAQWNSPVSFFWIKRRTLLKSEWEYLAEKFPDDESVRYAAGLWMLDAHQFTDSVSYLRAAAESQKLPIFQRGAAYYNLGFGLMNTRQFAEAEKALRAALEQSQPDMEAYCLLSEMYSYTGRIEDATRAEADCRSHAPK